MAWLVRGELQLSIGESLPIYFNKTYLHKKIRTITIYGSKLNTVDGVRCTNSQLSSLEVNNNPKLKTLEIGGNKLTTIDVSKNPELTRLDCTNNQLKSLDIGKTAIWNI